MCICVYSWFYDTMKSKFIYAAQAALALSLAMLASCASPANPTSMVPSDASVRKKHNATVNVAVTGGHTTNPMWTSQVSNEDFKQALETSLTRYGAFSHVIQDSGANYRLDVSLVRLKQPMVGFDMTVTAEVSWKLTDTRSGRVLWQQTTTSPYTATLKDEFIAVRRLQLANEGAIRQSIKTGIEHISALSF